MRARQPDGIIKMYECGGSTAGLVYSRCALKAWSGGARVPESRKISAPPSTRRRNTAAITYGLCRMGHPDSG